MLRCPFDENRRRFELLELEMCAADEKVELRVVEGPLREAEKQLRRSRVVALLQERVHLENRGIRDVVGGLAALEGLIENPNRFGKASEGMDEELGRVEHRLEVMFVEVDRLSIVVEGHFEVAVGRVDVPDEIVGIGRLPVELQRLLRGRHCATQVTLRDELPASVEVGAQSVHQAIVLLVHGGIETKLTWGHWDVKRKRALSCIVMVRLLTTLLIPVVLGCTVRSSPASETISVGASDQGYLIRAMPLPDQGQGFRRVRPEDSTRYGSETLIRAIEDVARSVDDAFPGGYPLRVGDLSSPHGGAHLRHRSHRAGRDADLLFYVRDTGGLPSRGAGWMGFDRFGLATGSGRTFVFDEARNWHLVKTLLLDPNARVKWLFCSDDIKTRLLRYASRHEQSAEAIVRATWVLHEPGRGDSHDDHFHLRVGCAREERAFGCEEKAPFWPWQDDAASKDDDTAKVAATDARLIGWLLGEQHLDERGDIARRRVSLASKPTTVPRGYVD